MKLEPVLQGELRATQPLPWPVYNYEGLILLDKGQVIESEQRLAELSLLGLFRQASSGTTPGAVEQPSPAASKAHAESKPQQETRELDELKLVVGDQLQIQSQSGTAQLRYYVKLIGYLKPKGIIVSTPMEDGKILLMREGQTFIARLFSGRSAYAFATSIIKVTNVPYPHLHLSYPSQVRGLLVRHGARAKVSLIAAALNEQGQTHGATLSNLSTGGCSLTAKQSLAPKGEHLTIKFRALVGDTEHYLSLDGAVRSTQEEQPEDGGVRRFVHGIQFIDVSPAQQLVLTAFVYQKLFEEAN